MNSIVNQSKESVLIPDSSVLKKSSGNLVDVKVQREFLKIFSTDNPGHFTLMIKQLAHAFTVIKSLNQKKATVDQKNINLCRQKILKELITEHFKLEENSLNESSLFLDNEKRYHFISLCPPSIAQEISNSALNFISFGFQSSERKSIAECSNVNTLSKKNLNFVVEEIHKILKKDELFVHLFTLDKCVELIIDQYPYDQFIHFPWMETKDDLKGLRIVCYQDLVDDLENNRDLKDFNRKFITELTSLSATELNKILTYLYRSNDADDKFALFNLSQWIRCLKITGLKKISFIDFSQQELVGKLEEMHFEILKDDEKVIDSNASATLHSNKVLAGLIDQTKFYRVVAQKS